MKLLTNILVPVVFKQPFFATWERGSGIGLSLERQIMYKHDMPIVSDTYRPGSQFYFLLTRSRLVL